MIRDRVKIGVGFGYYTIRGLLGVCGGVEVRINFLISFLRGGVGGDRCFVVRKEIRFSISLLYADCIICVCSMSYSRFPSLFEFSSDSPASSVSSSSSDISLGKHLICDLHDIQNETLLHSLDGIREILDYLCDTYSFTVLGKLEHQFTPQGCSLVYLLSESHLSVHTFPEKKYIAMDVYTCRDYADNSVYESIYTYLVEQFRADSRYSPVILDRGEPRVSAERRLSLNG